MKENIKGTLICLGMVLLVFLVYAFGGLLVYAAMILAPILYIVACIKDRYYKNKEEKEDKEN